MYSRADSPGLGQWAQAVTAIASMVGAVAPAVAQIVAKPVRPSAPIQILAAAPTFAPTAAVTPAAPAFTQAGMLGGGVAGMPTWGWVALGGGGLLLLLLFAGGRGGGQPVYIMERRRRRR